MQEVQQGYHPVEQGSPEWLQLRKSFVCTGSEFAAAAGIDPNKSRQFLWREKKKLILANPALEEHEESIRDACLWWGKTHEPEARDALSEILLGQPIAEVGMFELPGDRRFASSPDGIVILTGSPCEIKCPALKTSVALPTEAQYCQMLAHMACTGAKECHFLNYSPHEPCIYARVPFSDADWQQLYQYLQEFATYVEKDVEPPRLHRRRYLAGYHAWIRCLLF